MAFLLYLTFILFLVISVFLILLVRPQGLFTILSREARP